MIGRHRERSGPTRSAGCGLSNPVQITGRIVHRSDVIPMLPPVRERVSCRIQTGLLAIGRHEPSA